MPPLKILISGAGISGTAIALLLSKLGHSITVIEKAPTLRATGLQVDIRGHGIEVMKRMGLEQAYRSKIAPEQGLRVVNRSGKRVAYFPANKGKKGLQSFTTDWEIMRGDFVKIMYEASKDRTTYVFDMAIEGFEQKDDVVKVHFSSGKTENFDLLIGADGQWSRTRRMLFGEEGEKALHPLGGECSAYFITDIEMEKGEEYMATLYMAPGRRGIMTRRHSSSSLQVYIGGAPGPTSRLKNTKRGDVKEEKEALKELFKGAGWKSDEIVGSMMEADDFYLERMGVVKLERWSKGRVVLCGDAAYCPSPKTAMGTTSALVGSYILAGEISKHCGLAHSNGGESNGKDDLGAALKEYEEKFRPFMEQVQKGLLEEKGPDMMPTSAFGIGVMHAFLGVASFLRLNIMDYMGLKENVKGWELPEYKELEQQ